MTTRLPLSCRAPYHVTSPSPTPPTHDHRSACRLPPEQVLTICPAKSYEQLEGWSRRLGGLSFEKLKGVQLGPKAKEGASLRGSGVRF